MNGERQISIIPVLKKGDKQIIKHKQPVSLLPIGSKIFDKITFTSLFKYLEHNKLLTCNQSGFWPSDSCVHHLFSVTLKTYKSFDANLSPEVRDVFLDINSSYQRVFLNGQSSHCNVKLFANKASLFSTITSPVISHQILVKTYLK